MSMTQASSEYFDKVAGQWDQISSGYFGKAVRDAAIAKAYLHPEMVVADVGAGTGFIADGLAPLVRTVHLVDGSEAMLEVARKNLSQYSNIEYHLADGSSLPFSDTSLDAVFANMYLHHTVDPQAAIHEMVRILRPGGRLVITDMEEHPYSWLKDEMADVWQGFQRDQVRSWFDEAGLVNVIAAPSGQSCCAQSTNPTIIDQEGRQVSIRVFVASGTQRMAMRAAVQSNYSAIAKTGLASGCSPATADDTIGCCGSSTESIGGCCSHESKTAFVSSDEILFSTGYAPAELVSAPPEAAGISLGCGNPLAMAGLKAGEVVLDIGSGGGLDAFLAAAKVGPTGKVIGVDMTPDMLERARASAERNQITNVEFRQGYAEELPAADGEVDIIISNCVINLTEDKGRVFREAFRALKPGGRLEVSDMVVSGPVLPEFRQNAAGWSECINGALPEQEYLDLISQAGFENVLARRSSSMGEALGVSVYSVIASARKPDPTANNHRDAIQPEPSTAQNRSCCG